MMLEEGGTTARLPMGGESKELRAALSLSIGLVDETFTLLILHPTDLREHFIHRPDEHEDQGDDVNDRGGFDGRAGHGAGFLVFSRNLAKGKQA